ALAKP
ncbi:putative rTX toxin, partial [Vibrio parahaemolyticus AQ3810]